MKTADNAKAKEQGWVDRKVPEKLFIRFLNCESWLCFRRRAEDDVRGRPYGSETVLKFIYSERKGGDNRRACTWPHVFLVHGWRGLPLAASMSPSGGARLLVRQTSRVWLRLLGRIRVMMLLMIKIIVIIIIVGGEVLVLSASISSPSLNGDGISQPNRSLWKIGI